MYFQGFVYTENFGLVVLLFLTCKSSNKLRVKSKSILDLPKDEQRGIYSSRNSASGSSDISTHGTTVHVSEEVPSTEGKKRLIYTSEFDGSYSPHNTNDIIYLKNINSRSKIRLVSKNSSKNKKGKCELENILMSEALVDDKYFSVFSTLNDIKEKYIEFSQGKIQECERIFSKILQDINILLIKYVNQFILTDIIYTSDKSHIRVLFALKLVKSIITKSEYEIERILDSFTSTNIKNIDFDIEMKQIYENIFFKEDNSYLLDIMFRFDESDINEIYTLLQEDKNNGTGTSNFDKHLKSRSRKLSDHFISKIICYYFQPFDAKYVEKKFMELKPRFYALAQGYHTNKPIENDSFHGIVNDTYELIYKCGVNNISYVMTWDGFITKNNQSYIKIQRRPYKCRRLIQCKSSKQSLSNFLC
ncbi:hypothetical protein CWI38_0092p0050 [Hamiltosporidium tvaerminnensis]|uniref:Uncharacterized protein n=1 Tax=Hamiltosporidium tvaerminnensis TaxID=1176355 RepID=A0A4Q9M0X1_9MICR|nr:hypothetical protein CWI38_0092p0050 [Hamiltosporidium tvaerminnensis]